MIYEFGTCFFGIPGSNIDLNVLNKTPLIGKYVEECFNGHNFNVAGVNFQIPYFLTDCIYPSWPIFVKSFAEPKNQKKKHYSKVLQARFHIIRRPCRFWKLDSLQRVMTACVILHNMIVTDENNDDFASEHYLDFTTSETVIYQQGGSQLMEE